MRAKLSVLLLLAAAGDLYAACDMGPGADVYAMTDTQVDECDAAVRALAGELDTILRAANGRETFTKPEAERLNTSS
jgi:hypothetical protein